jgi:hypothetical protein
VSLSEALWYVDIVARQVGALVPETLSALQTATDEMRADYDSRYNDGERPDRSDMNGTNVNAQRICGKQ